MRRLKCPHGKAYDFSPVQMCIKCFTAAMNQIYGVDKAGESLAADTQGKLALKRMSK